MTEAAEDILLKVGVTGRPSTAGGPPERNTIVQSWTGRNSLNTKRSLSARRQSSTAQPTVDNERTGLPTRPNSTVLRRQKPASMSVLRSPTSGGNSPATPVPQLPNRNSTVTMAQSPSSGPGNTSQHRHSRGGGLGSALKRLFTRRDKSTSRSLMSPSQASSKIPQHSHHRSEPIAGGYADPPDSSNSEAIRRAMSAARSPALSESSTPVYTPRRLPFPMNLTAPESSIAKPGVEDAQPTHTLQRRATMPGVPLLGNTRSGSPLPILRIGSDPLTTVTSTNETWEAETIGLAITSGNHPHRRSRSTNNLFDLNRLDQSKRRRSAEIRFWRSSFSPILLRDSVYSDDQDEVIPNADQGRPVGQHTNAVPDDTANIERSPLRKTFVHAEGTPVDLRQRDEIPFDVIDQRLSLLESNMQDLSSSIQELNDREHSHRSDRQPYGEDGLSTGIASPTPAKSGSSRKGLQTPRTKVDTIGSHSSEVSNHRQSPFFDQNHFSQPSERAISGITDSSYLSSANVSGPVQTPLQILKEDKPSFSPQSLDLSPRKPTPKSRRDSAAASNPILVSSSTLDQTRDDVEYITTASIYTQLAPLYSALRYERLQRKNMEAQVEILTKQVNDLAMLLHRANQQQERERAQRLSQQSNLPISPVSTSQASFTSLSPTIPATAPAHYGAVGLGMNMVYSPPRSEAPSSSNFTNRLSGSGSATDSISASEPLAVMYPHYAQGYQNTPVPHKIIHPLDSYSYPYIHSSQPIVAPAEFYDQRLAPVASPGQISETQWSEYSDAANSLTTLYGHPEERDQPVTIGASQRHADSADISQSKKTTFGPMHSSTSNIDNRDRAEKPSHQQGLNDQAMPASILETMRKLEGSQAPSTSNPITTEQRLSELSSPAEQWTTPIEGTPLVGTSTTLNTRGQSDMRVRRSRSTSGNALHKSVDNNQTSSNHLPHSSFSPSFLGEDGRRRTQDGWVHAGNLKISPQIGGVEGDEEMF